MESESRTGGSFPSSGGLPHDKKDASPGNGVHVAFLAKTREAVDAFHVTALSAGAHDDGAPGPRPHYGEAYYGCFGLDPDNNKIEAMYWDPTLAKDYS